MADEEIVEVKTVKMDPPKTSGIILSAVAMVVVMGLLMFAVTYSGEPTSPLDTSQSQVE